MTRRIVELTQAIVARDATIAVRDATIAEYIREKRRIEDGMEVEVERRVRAKMSERIPSNKTSRELAMQTNKLTKDGMSKLDTLSAEEDTTDADADELPTLKRVMSGEKPAEK